MKQYEVEVFLLPHVRATLSFIAEYSSQSGVHNLDFDRIDTTVLGKK